MAAGSIQAPHTTLNLPFLLRPPCNIALCASDHAIHYLCLNLANEKQWLFRNWVSVAGCVLHFGSWVFLRIITWLCVFRSEFAATLCSRSLCICNVDFSIWILQLVVYKGTPLMLFQETNSKYAVVKEAKKVCSKLVIGLTSRKGAKLIVASS